MTMAAKYTRHQVRPFGAAQQKETEEFEWKKWNVKHNEEEARRSKPYSRGQANAHMPSAIINERSGSAYIKWSSRQVWFQIWNCIPSDSNDYNAPTTIDHTFKYMPGESCGFEKGIRCFETFGANYISIKNYISIECGSSCAKRKEKAASARRREGEKPREEKILNSWINQSRENGETFQPRERVIQTFWIRSETLDNDRISPAANINQEAFPIFLFIDSETLCFLSWVFVFQKKKKIR